MLFFFMFIFQKHEIVAMELIYIRYLLAAFSLSTICVVLLSFFLSFLTNQSKVLLHTVTEVSFVITTCYCRMVALLKFLTSILSP